MTGREEYDEKLDNACKNYLIGKPELLKKYYYYCKRSKSKTGSTILAQLGYAYEFMRYLENHNMNPDDISIYKNILPMDIDQYQEEFGYKYTLKGKIKLSEGTMARKFFVVKDFFKFLKQNNIIANNPLQDVNGPKNTKVNDIVYLTPEEVKQVSEYMCNEKGRLSAREVDYIHRFHNQNLAIFRIGIITGLRISAICNLNVEDINLDERYLVSIDKGRKTRKCKFDKETRDIILAWLIDRQEMLDKIDKQMDALFISDIRFNRISDQAISKMLQKYTEFLGKHVTPHKMRHTCGTNLYMQTGNLEVVRAVLDHSDIKNTMKYARASEKEKEMAADMLGNLF